MLIFNDVEVLDFARPFEVFSRTRLVAGAESRRGDDSGTPLRALPSHAPQNPSRRPVECACCRRTRWIVVHVQPGLLVVNCESRAWISTALRTKPDLDKYVAERLPDGTY
jgi:predicted nucleic acid-binding Zn ribbon protein